MKIYKRLPIMTNATAERFLGKFVEEKHVELLLDETAGVVDYATGEPLLYLIRGGIPDALTRTAFKNLLPAAKPTRNRGIASGYSDTGDTDAESIGKRTKHRYRLLKKDGTLSNTHLAKPVNSGLVGSFESNPRFPYCRQTVFTVRNRGKVAAALPYIRAVDSIFKQTVPERYAAQKRFVEKVHSDYVLPETAFTTITVNKNWQTACHKDKGDLKRGFGVLSVLSRGTFDGCYLTFPQYGIAANIQNGDVVLANVHLVHGNTPFKDCSKYFQRISLVCCVRRKIDRCDSLEREIEKAKVLLTERAKRINTGGTDYAE